MPNPAKKKNKKNKVFGGGEMRCSLKGITIGG